MDDFRCLMVGLPKTGKSTFLGALWHVVRSKEVTGSLELVRREGSQAYLNDLADSWSQCNNLDRTPFNGELDISPLLTDCESGRNFKLAIPDTSGEMYQSNWELRQCSSDFASLAKRSHGCLLFIHPETVDEPKFLADARSSLLWSGGQNEANALPPVVIEWEPKFAPTQTKLVEVLQDIIDFNGSQLRIAVIVSAWDLVGNDTKPETWFRQRLPLLWQFLTSNSTEFAFTVFGVSAQGGSNDDADSLLEFENPSQRILVVHDNYSGNDITLPIKWLLNRPKPSGEVTQ